MTKPRENFEFGLFLTIGIVGIIIAGVLMNVTGDDIKISAYSPKKNLSAYHLIDENDIANTSMLSLLPHEDVVQNRSQILGKYTIVPVSSDQVIKDSMLGDVPDGWDQKNTVVLSFDATSGMIFEGGLQCGDIMDIIMMPKGNSSVPISFNDIMLIDVKERSGENAQKTCIFVVALNRSEKERFFNSSRESDIRIVKVFNKN